jgi:hypothetical protein
MAQKRFIYWTADGKRHWTPLFDPPIALDPSEFAEFDRADKFYGCCRPRCCTRPPGPAETKSETRVAMVRDR